MQGILEPDSGSVVIGPTVKIGYFAQEIQLGKDMDPNQRVIDYIRDVAEYVETDEGKITAARLLERFLFRGEDQYGLIGKLSGGERRRLYLCKVLMSAPNVLILDEPTNDLDITTLTILEDYLDSFQGIVVAVSHDRYFLDRVVRRIFAFRPDGTLWQSEGGYTDYETRVLYEQQAAEKSAGAKTETAESKTGKSDNWKEKPRTKKLKLSYQEQREYDTIEDDIATLEQRIEENKIAMEKMPTIPPNCNGSMKSRNNSNKRWLKRWTGGCIWKIWLHRLLRNHSCYDSYSSRSGDSQLVCKSRYFFGVSPYNSWKELVKWLWEEKFKYSEISEME